MANRAPSHRNRGYGRFYGSTDTWRDDAFAEELRELIAVELGFRPDASMTLREAMALGEADPWEPPPEKIGAVRQRPRLTGEHSQTPSARKQRVRRERKAA